MCWRLPTPRRLRWRVPPNSPMQTTCVLLPLPGQPAVGSGRDLRADMGRLRVPGSGDRCLQPKGGGLVDGRAQDRRTRDGGAEHGAAHAQAGLGDPSFRPRQPVHQHHLRQLLPRNGRTAVDGHSGRRLRDAMAKSFFPSLECELIDRRSWKSRTEAKLAVFTWIEAWYNPHRLQFALSYLPPINFDEKHRANNDRAQGSGLPTAAVGSSQAPTAAVANPASHGA